MERLEEESEEKWRDARNDVGSGRDAVKQGSRASQPKLSKIRLLPPGRQCPPEAGKQAQIVKLSKKIKFSFLIIIVLSIFRMHF